MNPAVKFVDLDSRPIAAALLQASLSSPGTLVVAAGRNRSNVPLDELTAILAGPTDVGVVLSVGPRDRFSHSPNREFVGNPIPGCEFAVTAGLLARVPADIGDDAHTVLRKLIGTASDAGRRVVELHSWLLQETAIERWRGRSSTADETGEILIIADPPRHPLLSLEDRATRDLIDGIRLQAGRLGVSLLTLGTCPPAVIDPWLAKGVSVLEGPGSRFGSALKNRFSHVVVSGSAFRAGARRWIEANLPLAYKVLFLPTLPQNAFSNLAPIISSDELQGLDHAAAQIHETVEGWCRWANAVWCNTPGDAAALAASRGSAPVRIIPLAATRETILPFTDRAGIVISAASGHDVAAGNEDSSIRVLREVIPLVTAADAATKVTVIADDPTPMLRETSRSVGAELLPSKVLDKALRSGRVFIAAHGYGSGQPSVIMRCLEVGTPFVIGPFTAGSLSLGAVTGRSLFGAAADLASQTRQLLYDPGIWTRAVTESAQLVTSTYSATASENALRSALAEIGIVSRRPTIEWPKCRMLPHPDRPQKVLTPLRPLSESLRAGRCDAEPLGEAARYRAWVELHGPTAQTLSSLKVEIDRLNYRPLVSILMPVYNTAPNVLSEAIESVRCQIYENWQLCIADDGSTDDGTKGILEGLEFEPRVKVVRLRGSSGISGATNAALAVADGEYVTFLDHDDLLKPHALAQVARWLNDDPSLDIVYSDEDKIDSDGQLYDPHVKPDWSPDQLMTQNYLCHLMVARRSLVETVGGLRSHLDGSQDYDLALRMTEMTDRIAHIPEPLYSWRAVPGSAAADPNAKPYALQAAKEAVREALIRRGYDGQVDTMPWPGCFRARYDIPGTPRVAIIIPTRDRLPLLKRCVTSIVERSTYKNYEVVIIDNQSSDGETLSYLANFPGTVIRYPERFNYARMMNLAAGSVECDALLFLNNDTDVISPDWIETLLEHAMRPEVGAVGCRLYFGDGTPQHEGILVGVGGGWALNLNHNGYWIRGDLTRNVSAVTGACTMIRPKVFWEVGGNDERLRVAYNDVDLCLRIRQAGYQIVYTPFAELYHHESSSRAGYEHEEDGPLFGIRWHPHESGDPYYSPMFEVHRPFLIRV